ncbi:aminoglycoside phosphotransferase family protein [Kutzneria kofuensis]|uniref:Aminoglycoside phosphotransferase (APT) family kinase protein n=1 Tax=Kutzneria kofuensis TaxID=103725 RepID=A0A7W9NE36_9PSEU|nr:aminoglycoside phosphotransferase family protein [Kutzneria kofuensis]MBB5889295.1 aminoglycoside phosphotransferase (APT) family kinase protein [Kutzneria kofuensis]
MDLLQAGQMLRPLWPDVAVTAVVPRTGSRLSTVYEVRAGDRTAIIKVYADKWRWKQAKEAHVYRLLAEHGVGPVPTVLRVEPDADVAGRAFTVMTRLPGTPLSETSVDDIADVYRQLGRMLATIHAIPQPGYGYITTHVLDAVPDNTAYMGRQFAKKLREFRELRGDAELHDLVQTYVAAHSDLFARCPAPVLCRNDAHEGNVLVEDGKITGLVDSENALAGDPWLDLAKVDFYTARGDATRLDALLDGYGAVPDERMRLYKIYHALELWDWFAASGETEYLDGIATEMADLAADA